MTKQIFNIFSKNKVIIKKDICKQKIIVDHREKSSLVPSLLLKLNFDIEFKQLNVADYIIKDVAIERKTVSDFINSMINRRLINQLQELQQYKNKLLIIEGLDEQELYSDNRGVNPNAIRGFLLSILLKYKIPIIYTKDAKDTAKFISILAKKREKETSLNAKKKTFNKKEQLQYIVESFPGIGPANAKKLLKEFKTIKEIINTPLEKLQKILGKKAEIFKLTEEKY